MRRTSVFLFLASCNTIWFNQSERDSATHTSTGIVTSLTTMSGSDGPMTTETSADGSTMASSSSASTGSMERPSSTSEATGSASEGTTLDTGGGSASSGGGGVLPDCPTAEKMENADYSDGCKGPMAVRLMFVTSSRYDGDLRESGTSGVEGADIKCTRVANEAGLKGSYKAWLSTSMESVVDRFDGSVLNDRVIVRPDGKIVADDWKDLVEGWVKQDCWEFTVGCASDKHLKKPVSVTETAEDLSSMSDDEHDGGKFWSATFPDGSKVAFTPLPTCIDWTWSGDLPCGLRGQALLGDWSWTAEWKNDKTVWACSACSSERHLVCMQYSLG